MAKPSLFFSFLPQISLTFAFIPLLLLLVGNTCSASSILSSSSDPFSLQQRDKVLNLPGQTFNVKFDHYAGYVTVNEESGRNLFYWFIEAAKNPESKPLVLWLNGGPGCSSIAYGEAEEIGPFYIQSDGKTLYLNPHSWNRVANLLFVESPVGVGFSYSNTPSDLLNNGDKRAAKDSLKFLLKWFERFPQYKGRDFYIAGESYAGHYIPQLSQVIVKHNRKTKEDINLKGFIVGNAAIDEYHDNLGFAEFLWSSGMISDQTYQQMSLQCGHEPSMHSSGSCEKVSDIADKEMGTIDPYSIFTNLCPGNASQTNYQLMKRKRIISRLSRAYDPCTEAHSVAYFNQPEVQNALHVDPNHKPEKWVACSDVVYENWKDSPLSVLDVYGELISQGLRIWMFSGDTDAVVPVTSTRHSINAMKLSTVSDWRPWYDDGQVGGWTQDYDGLTFVVVRGAGHEVPMHRPKLALALIKAFLSGSSMPSLELHSAF